MEISKMPDDEIQLDLPLDLPDCDDCGNQLTPEESFNFPVNICIACYDKLQDASL